MSEYERGRMVVFFFFQAEDGIRDIGVTGVQTCALPIFEDQREAPLDDLGAQLERGAGHTGQQTGAVVDDGAAGVVVPMPADRKRVVWGKSGDLGGRRIIKKKNN